jgi:hypothetical protein
MLNESIYTRMLKINRVSPVEKWIIANYEQLRHVNVIRPYHSDRFLMQRRGRRWVIEALKPILHAILHHADSIDF